MGLNKDFANIDIKQVSKSKASEILIYVRYLLARVQNQAEKEELENYKILLEARLAELEGFETLLNQPELNNDPAGSNASLEDNEPKLI
ncbi:hypothetical protein [Adhaeribacter aquaticus]|uniref:hypothetical protein n=1 Tax=Adhaeribacter aquaticus TaxID=299567 RepID=UPI00041974A0|nr:hypothetical protein [Adhaeribacter aquaticus]